MKVVEDQDANAKQREILIEQHRTRLNTARLERIKEAHLTLDQLQEEAGRALPDPEMSLPCQHPSPC